MRTKSLLIFASVGTLIVAGAGLLLPHVSHSEAAPVSAAQTGVAISQPAPVPRDMSDEELVAFVRSHRETAQADDPIINQQMTVAIHALEHSHAPERVAGLVDALGFMSDAPLQAGPPATVHDFSGAVKYALDNGHWDVAELYPAYGVLRRQATPAIIDPMLDEIGMLPAVDYAQIMARAAEILALCEPIDQVQTRLQVLLDTKLSDGARTNYQTTLDQLNHLKPVASQR